MDVAPQSGVPSGDAETQANEAPAVEREAARSAAPAEGGSPPLLDKELGNVPKGRQRPSWLPKQWMIRRAVIDRLRYWQTEGYQCLWVTLTSSPSSPEARLRADFQVLRKRIARELEFAAFEYVCVDTREGHGVLHMIWAWKDPNRRKRASFYIEFAWLQEQWKDIHGAFHVNVKRIGGSDSDARRLSRYIVAQYCGGQNALVRLSQSRIALPLAKMREALRRAVFSMPERYEFGHRLVKIFSGKEFTAEFNRCSWTTFRVAWDKLVRTRACEAFGVQFVWFAGELQQV